MLYDPWTPYPAPTPWPGPSFPPTWGRQAQAPSNEDYIALTANLPSQTVSDIIGQLRALGVSGRDLELFGMRLGLSVNVGLQHAGFPHRHLAPELAPVAWAAIGFAGGAIARIAGRQEAFGVAVAAFLAGAAAGARAVDGRL